MLMTFSLKQSFCCCSLWLMKIIMKKKCFDKHKKIIQYYYLKSICMPLKYRHFLQSFVNSLCHFPKLHLKNSFIHFYEKSLQNVKKIHFLNRKDFTFYFLYLFKLSAWSTDSFLCISEALAATHWKNSEIILIMKTEEWVKIALFPLYGVF